MTTRDFNKKFKQICLKYGYKFEPKHKGQLRYTADTPFGKIQVLPSPTPRIKSYTIFYRFLEDFDISYFYRYFSKHETINRFSKIF